MMANKIKIQCLIFDRKFFNNKSKVRAWINMNGFVMDKRLKHSIMRCNDTFRVRQKNPDWFNKKTFKCESLGKGIKGVYGVLKKG